MGEGGNRQEKTTAEFARDELEKLATRSVRAPTHTGEPLRERGLARGSDVAQQIPPEDLHRPTTKIHRDELLGLLDPSDVRSEPAPEPAKAIAAQPSVIVRAPTPVPVPAPAPEAVAASERDFKTQQMSPLEFQLLMLTNAPAGPVQDEPAAPIEGEPVKKLSRATTVSYEEAEEAHAAERAARSRAAPDTLPEPMPSAAQLDATPEPAEDAKVPPLAPQSLEITRPQPVLPQTVLPQAVVLRAVVPQTILPQTVPPQTVTPQTVTPQTIPPQTVPPQTVTPQAVPPQAPQTIPQTVTLVTPQTIPQTVTPPTVTPQTVLPQTVEVAPQMLPISPRADARPPSPVPVAEITPERAAQPEAMAPTADERPSRPRFARFEREDTEIIESKISDLAIMIGTAVLILALVALIAVIATR